MEVATEAELIYLDGMLESVESNIALGMSYVRKAQGWTFDELSERFVGVSPQLLKRYMQQGYVCVRPIHFIAAYSWVTMVPMTSFYKGFKIRESYRGMDEAGVEALICIARMPHDLFEVVLQCIYCFLSDTGKQGVDALRHRLAREFGVFDQHFDELYSAPPVIDIDKFAESYYYSVAITAREFRVRHGLTMKAMARVLGLSEYKYKILEDPDNPQYFSLSIGVRVKLGFKLDDHVQFTQKMQEYSQFHGFRILQHIRDSLLIESLRHISDKQKKYVIEVIRGLAAAHANQ